MEEVYKRLTEYILDWNTKINVTAIRDPEEFYEKNIRDSLAVMELPEFAEAYRILDLGTGGGFPGLPLAIANPDIIVDENTVAELLKTFSEDETLLMCAPVMKDAEGKYRIRTQQVPSYVDDLVACFTDNNKTVRFDNFDYLNGRKNMILTEMLPGSFFIVRTELFRQIGMLDEGVFLFCEERILGYRMKQYGYKSVLRSDFYFIHKHGTSIGKSYKIAAARKMLLKSRCYYQKVYNKCGLIKEIIFIGVSALSLVYLYIKLFASYLLRSVKKNH